MASLSLWTDPLEAMDLGTLLERHPVFGQLPPAKRQFLAHSLDIRPLTDGAEACDAEALYGHLHWLVAGHLSLVETPSSHLLTIRPGQLFGLLPADTAAGLKAVAVGPGQLVSLGAAVVAALRREHRAMAVLLPEPPPAALQQRSPHPVPVRDLALNLMAAPVRGLIRREPVTLPPQTPIQAAARRMREQRVSSVLIVEGSHLYGLVTDRDLRNRVLATGMDSARPIMDVATLAPLCIDIQRPAFDALLLMARHNIHHLPVLDGTGVAGMITATDLNEQSSSSAVYLAGDIYKQTRIEGLQQASAHIQRLQRNLAAAEASAYRTGHLIAAVTDALTIRLLQLGEAQLGPAPVDYVWVAAGSQARQEQTAPSDQDNCLVLDDRFDEALHGPYFKALARWVCDGLAACGYGYCPGEMMAVTDAWRQPHRQWADRFARWLREPDPTALMLTCVFFDLRAIHGNTDLLDSLRREVLQNTPGSGLFLTHMAHNALSRRPPLGPFKRISPLRTGGHRGRIDLKLNGVAPIVDMARLFALAAGHPAVNTQDRLDGAAAGGTLSEPDARDLRDAFEFLGHTRLQLQARQISAGQPPDHFLNPGDVSNFERSQLKDAFSVVQSAQNLIAQRYTF
jgi:CBS domain-containing protein